MIDEGHAVAALHGLKEGEERDKIIDGFRLGKTKVLITTNVVARGIDISQVNMVVNYDTPDHVDGSADTETYLHRVGRTGRFGKKGIAILFVTDRDSERKMRQIERTLGKPIIRVQTGDYEEMERVSFGCGALIGLLLWSMREADSACVHLGNIDAESRVEEVSMSCSVVTLFFNFGCPENVL